MMRVEMTYYREFIKFFSLVGKARPKSPCTRCGEPSYRQYNLVVLCKQCEELCLEAYARYGVDSGKVYEILRSGRRG